MKKKIVFFAFILGCMVLAPALSNISYEPALEGDFQRYGLFYDSNVSGDIDFSRDPTIIRSRFVNINFDLLSEPDGRPSVSGDVLVLNLFNDVLHTAIRDHVELNLTGGFSWVGHLDGVEYSHVTLVMKDGIVVGNITLPRAFYQVRYAGNGVHAVHQIDQSAFPNEADPVEISIPEREWIRDELMADDGSTIDVLVAYTADARTAAGGTTAMNSLINLAVSETNTTYLNSGIAQRVNLVHTTEVTYTETGDMYTDLPRLANTSDGYMDNVHSLRDTYCADEVVLIIADGGPYCGLAYMMTTVSASFASSAFAVVDDGCATGYYSFGHEMGHNMGAHHDWYVNSSISPYPYNHGYVNSANRWRTVMAYNAECSAGGFSCTRIPYWSNPNVLYGGNPTGIPEGTSTSCVTGVPNPNCDADNRKTLNNTALTVANFRQSCSGESQILWALPANGYAHLWKLNSSDGIDSTKGFALAAGWWATSYHRGSSHLLWTDPVNGYAHLWDLNESNQIVGTKGFALAAQWWAMSYHRNTDGSGYILWSLPSSGYAHLWTLNASNQIVSTKGFALAAGWWATSYHRNADGSSFILWTDPVNGYAHLWTLNASNQIVSTKGFALAAGWWAMSYHRNADSTGQMLWTHPVNGYAHLWNLNAILGLVTTKGFSLAAGWWGFSYHGRTTSSGDIF